MKQSEKKIFDKKTIKAIIGLGNVGSKYNRTRHNIGFRVIDELAHRLHASWLTDREMEYAEVKLSTDPYDINAKKVLLIKPLTFMNNSGRVIPSLQKKGIKSEEILVVHDELEKEFGHVSYHSGGGAKGHNGLRSIIGVIGKDFWRIRFGIGRPEDRDDVGNYVLMPFKPEEEQEILFLIEKTLEKLL